MVTTVVPYERSGDELVPIDPNEDDGLDSDGAEEEDPDRLHSLTRIEQISSGRYVLAADYSQNDELDPHTVRYFDRRLNVESPWGAD